MRDCHLVIHDGLVAIFLLEDLAFQLERLNVMRHVIKVDCSGLLLEELNAFDSNLREAILVLIFVFVAAGNVGQNHACITRQAFGGTGAVCQTLLCCTAFDFVNATLLTRFVYLCHYDFV